MDFVFASDIDNTLVGGPVEHLEKLNKKLIELEEQNKLFLILSTGRSLEEVVKGFQDESLPYPKAVISQVGTEIYLSPFKVGQKPFEDWEKLLKKDFDRNIAEGFIKEVEGVEMQPDIYNTDLKLSVFLHNAKDPETSVKKIKDNIKDHEKGSHYQVVWSSGKHLDIIPNKAGKGNAIQFLIDKLDLKPNLTVVAGDSGNDIAMFEKFDHGIIVSNAQPELMMLADKKITYFTSEKPYAEGVLEGLIHYEIIK